MKDINYIKDGEYLTGFKDESDVGVLNRPVYELAGYVQKVFDYLKEKGIDVEEKTEKESSTIEWQNIQW